MVVRTDTYGAYIWNGTAVAAARYCNEHAGCICDDRTIPQGVYEIQIAPSNSNILYMDV